MRRWIFALPLVVLAGLVLLFAGYALKHDPHVDPAALVGQAAPATPLAPLGGGAALPLARAAQGPFLINFFASWCAPCRQEQPALLALKALGVRIVGVDYKDQPDAARVFLKTLDDPFTTVLADPQGRAGVDYGISGVPETFLVDGDGRVLAKHIGPLTRDAAEALAERIDRR